MKDNKGKNKKISYHLNQSVIIILKNKYSGSKIKQRKEVKCNRQFADISNGYTY